MFNYSNLSSYEFELLCRDIVQAKTGFELSCFAPGPDRGIDATNIYKSSFSNQEPCIILQAKHYVRSPYSKLEKQAKELVKTLAGARCDSLFFMTSMPLTPRQVEELKKVLKEITNDINVYGVQDIDDYLSSSSGPSILSKHFNLWLSSTNVLAELINNSTNLECEQLIASIKEKDGLFVETSSFQEALRIMTNLGFVLLVGSPGVGKTTVSQMITLKYVEQGYKLIYTTDANIVRVENSISPDPDVKELIFLDDFLGQSYWKTPDVLPKQIEALIGFCANRPHKKLLLNSRITILNDVRSKSPDFNYFLCNKKKSEYLIDMDKMPDYEKARILYSHLVKLNLSQPYLQNIIDNKAYRNVVKHKNYNPRIVEYTCVEANLQRVLPDDFAKHLIAQLDAPADVWANEFNQRLKPEDRILMNTLVSLTDTTIARSTLQVAFEQRMHSDDNHDPSINHFEDCLKRLTESMIRVSLSGHEPYCSTVNPSVNDFLKSEIATNSDEALAIVENAVDINQLERIFHFTDSKKVKETVINLTFSDDVWQLGSRDVVYEGVLSIYSQYDFIDERIKNMAVQAARYCVEHPSWRGSMVVGKYLDTVIKLINSKCRDKAIEILKFFAAMSNLEYLAERVPMSVLDRFVGAVKEIFSIEKTKEIFSQIKDVFASRISDEVIEDTFSACDIKSFIEEYLADDAGMTGVENSSGWQCCHDAIRDTITEEANSEVGYFFSRYEELNSIVTEEDLDIFDAVVQVVNIEEEMRSAIDGVSDARINNDVDIIDSSRNNEREIDIMFQSLLNK